MAYIKVENLKYRYPNTKTLALDDLNFGSERSWKEYALSGI